MNTETRVPVVQSTIDTQVAYPPHSSSQQQGLTFTEESGKTSPVLSRTSMESRQIEQTVGLKLWMSELQKALPPLPADTLSNAQPQLAVTQHLVWDVKKINFEARTLDAKATYTYRNKVLDTADKKGNDKLVLDVKDLNIHSVKIDGSAAAFEIIENPNREDPNKFDALQVTIPTNKPTGDVEIEYTTDPKASGLFWVDKQFTTGKQYPLLYTLFEANEGASVIPGQHSPQVRLSWKVNVSTGSSDLMALSSVKNNPKTLSPSGKYEGLYMDRKIPLYLLCLEVGQMAYAEYMPGYGIYSEPTTLEKAKQSFRDMPKYVACAEKIFGPYKWERYDASILCNAFPYSAMEHACKSTFGAVCMGKPEVIAHEITHSWLGNDITNATWYEFYLNEGFTVFGEVMIMAEMHGWDHASLGMLETLKEMEKAINEYRDSRPGLLPLVSTDIEFTRIPYGKGALFFFMLRDAIGHEKFGGFLKDYMNLFYQNSMSTERLLAFLKEWLKHEMKITDFEKFKTDNKIDEWLHGKEIPDNRPEFTSKLLDGIVNEAKNVLADQPVNTTLYNQWTEQMKSTFLGELEGKITPQQLARLVEQLNPTDDISLVMRNAWSQIFATTGYYNAKTREFIINFILDRNSKHLTNLISATLCKTTEGRSIAEEILRRGKEKNCLFEVTRNVIGENIKKNMS